MKKIIVLFSLIGFNLFCFSQQLEIDRLYEKYKNSETIVLYTTQGDITANVYIEMNDDNKPKSITISGSSYSEDAIKELIGNMVSKKRNLGFKGKCDDLNGLFFADANNRPFKKCSLKKGTQYFNSKLDYIEFPIQSPIIYYFTIETGEMKRAGGKNAKDLDF